MARIAAAKRFRTILSVLEQEYGRRERYTDRSPVEQALVTVLLKNGKEGAAERALRRIEKHFVDLNEMRVCHPGHLDELLGRAYPPGVGEVFANTLTSIFNHAQSMTLDDIMELDPKQAEAKFHKMKLLPSRVAGEFLMSRLGYKQLPPSPGLLRVAKRTELASRGPTQSQTKTLRRLVPKSLIARMFHAFEMLAERVCTAKAFDCRACPLNELCPTGVKTLERLAAQEEKERAARQAETERLTRKRTRERRARARKKAATARLKKTIQARSKKLKISPKKTGRRVRPKPVAVHGTKMVQASSAEVKPDRSKTRRRKKKTASRPRAVKKS